MCGCVDIRPSPPDIAENGKGSWPPPPPLRLEAPSGGLRILLPNPAWRRRCPGCGPQGPGQSRPPTVRGLLSALGLSVAQGWGPGGPGGCGKGISGLAACTPDQRHSWDDRARVLQRPAGMRAPSTPQHPGAQVCPLEPVLPWPPLAVAHGGTRSSPANCRAKMCGQRGFQEAPGAPGSAEFWEPDAGAVAVAPRSLAAPTSADLTRLPAQC